MNISYSHLATITFKHPYFKDDLFKSLNISFSEDTSKILRDLGIVTKSFSGGIYLLARDPKLLNITINNLQPIRLYFNCNDPYYINFTALTDYHPSDTVLYFNNLPDHALLQVAEYVGIDDVFPLSSGKMTIPLFDESKTYFFKDVQERMISEIKIQKSNLEPDNFIIDELPEGVLRVFEGADPVNDIYYNPNKVWKKPMGILEIYPEKLYQDFMSNGTVDYMIQFNNRKTIWKYYLLDPVYHKFNDLSILNSNNESVFYPLKEESIQNSKAWVFESINELPLLEYSELSLRLVSEGTKVVIKQLPHASPEQLFTDNENSTYMYSHIYI